LIYLFTKFTGLRTVSFFRFNGCIRVGIKQFIKLTGIRQLQAKHPAVAIGVFINQFRRICQVFIDGNDSTGKWSIDIRCGLDRFDDGALLSLFKATVDLR
jgi:hypothetical protein